jgi:hypothetical protein
MSETGRKKVSEIQGDLLNAVTQALNNAGFVHLDVHSLQLKVRTPLKCPEGTNPVFECTAKPDGSIVCEWVCK